MVKWEIDVNVLVSLPLPYFISLPFYKPASVLLRIEEMEIHFFKVPKFDISCSDLEEIPN